MLVTIRWRRRSLFAAEWYLAMVEMEDDNDIAETIFLALRIWTLLFYVGDAGNTSLVDAGTPLGATAVVTQGVLVIYFGSAASWRPSNVEWPHQGLVPHS